ncbi:Ndc1 protein (macronuclear) [Tetrahymena thermophila SB210]|uniref:Ndc1 protein n=1 Tax=Tetrahymena thermophila (strain SB210) TaxID=312017 RepID=Q24HM7_TETTS|nr:Ndc1 protein [Tetrahymena thermophila SB210]EAS07284.3 Ndc1 protein [Tetrahymena thermophila SB210]|eukprot:XP_001027526.3 Ndc1 protein [Tetrahymena thermophila SB210]
MNKALVFLAIIALGFAASTQQVSALDPSENAADALIDQLNQMEGAIRKEQQAHDELAQEQDAECAQEFQFRQNEINDAQNAFDAANAAAGRCQNALTASQADLEKANNYVSSIQQILAGLASQRLAEHNAYEDLVNNQLQPAIDAVQGAYPILSDFASQTVSFVQFSNHINKMFLQMVKANKVNSFTAILTVLLSQPDFQHGVGRDAIDQLQALFEQLEQDLQAALDHATEVENNAVQVYNDTVNEYNAVLATLDATISSLNDYISSLENCVQNENSIASQANAKKVRNSDALAYAVDMCQAFDTEYQNATAARNDELALLQKLENFVHEQADIFGDYGTDNVDAFDDFKQSYDAQRDTQRGNFMQMKIKQFKMNSNFKKVAKCESCSRKSFVQKKLGF